MPSDVKVALAAAKKQVIEDWQRAQQSLVHYISIAEHSDQRDILKQLQLAPAGPSFTAVSSAANGRKRPAESDDEDEDGKKGKKGGKRVKKEKDPNAPRRPASAFILFQNAVRSEMRAANPDLDHKELAREIGDRWKNMKEEEKKPWSEEGKKAMEEYQVARKAYDADHPDGPPVVTRVSPAAPAVDGAAAAGEKPKKKRGRPSNAELAARAAAAGAATDGKTTTASTSPKKSSAPAQVESSDDSSDEDESSDESTDSEEAAAAAVTAPRPGAAAATTKKGAVAARQESSEESSEESSDSEVEAPKRPPPPPVASATKSKPAKVKADKKVRK